MFPQETAPPFENWEAHLRELGDEELKQLARDYQWIDEEARPQEDRNEFHRRRQAVTAECARRKMEPLA